jgi:hypothetical protein
MDIELFDLQLPEELIAQSPMAKRDDCRLLVVDREKKTIEHKHFHDIIDYLNPGDVLVRNNTKVIPARLVGIKEDTKGKVEVLLLHQVEGGCLGVPRRQCPFGQRRARFALWRRGAELHLRQSAPGRASGIWNSIIRGFSSRSWISLGTMPLAALHQKAVRE